jgi:hypothetical protein
MERVSTGSAYIDGTPAAIYELTRTYQKRLVAVPVGHHNDVVDRGGEGQAYVTFPEIYSDELHSRLQAMIAAQTSLDARRRLRDQGGNAIAIVLEQADGSALHASVGPPRFAYQAVEDTSFPITLAG